MKSYLEQLECLGYIIPQDINVSLSLNGLSNDLARFVKNYNMRNMGKTIGALHDMLIKYEKGLPKKAATPQVLAIQDYLKACGIVQQLTPPYTPQNNGVFERRNRTLLDMVWGCEALVKHDRLPDFNKDLLKFFENDLITKEVGGKAVELEEIQEEDTSPSKNTS
uniref:Zinc finger, CCHC-type n=1 Tax=Tanacetum cinerariifolium TaxID=118510 RepID=A0A6L2NZ25_TANCI|nr:zinc finger, CCHC-type [Tanacetum cinerariifolium]